MLRLIRKAAPLAFVLALGFQGVSDAQPTGYITIQNYRFTPATATGPLGARAVWTNKDYVTHTATSDATNPDGSTGIKLWNSGNLGYNQSYGYTFRAAGTYPYYCVVHPYMVADLKVLPQASPTSGSVGTQFTITFALLNPPAGYVFDIQKKDPGGSFQDWRTAVTTMSTTFDSTGMATGTYQFQVRLRRTSNNGASYYSPPVSVSVTP